MAEDSLLFIDANIYLDLYRNPHDQGVLDQLTGLSTRIFSTRQVVEEVKRRKKQVVAEALKKIPILEPKKISRSLPIHLLSVQQNADLGALLKTSIPELNRMLNTCKEDLKTQIDRQEDAVSRVLALIFRNPTPHTAEELDRARERRDRGNPPGDGPKVGDQLNWEQLLVQFRGKGRLRQGLWGRYRRKRGDLLLDELRALNAQAEAYLFDDLVKGMEDFVKNSSAS